MFNLSIIAPNPELDIKILEPYKNERHAQTACDMLRCLAIASFPLGRRLYIPLDNGQRKRLSEFSCRWEILLDQANIALSRAV